jgi:flagellar hook assembly protein FlgD
MYISPNPLILPDDERVLIKNIPSGSIIKIMTINGTLIKEIQLSSNESQAIWDGRNEKGEQVGTAVYLVAAHHPFERNKVSKIAVIWK